MRSSLLILLPLLVVAFAVGRVTNPGNASATSTSHTFSGRFGDVFRVPSAAARCLVSEEAGSPNVICSHSPSARARYSVVFYKDNLFVYRNGNPDNPVFSAHGKP